MSAVSQNGIFLIVDFDWPEPFTEEATRQARQLYRSVEEQTWIKNVMAASGGLGGGPAASWVFWLENYAALDRLLRAPQDPVCQAYVAFFSSARNVAEKLRQEITL